MRISRPSVAALNVHVLKHVDKYISITEFILQLPNLEHIEGIMKIMSSNFFGGHMFQVRKLILIETENQIQRGTLIRIAHNFWLKGHDLILIYLI